MISRVCLVAAALCCTTPAAVSATLLCQGGGVNVTLRVYSGSANPTAALSAVECQQAAALSSTSNGQAPSEVDVVCARMGYNGFVVHAGHQALFVVPGSNRALETFLLLRLFRETDAVVQHVSERLALEDPCLPLNPRPAKNIFPCRKVPIRGPDAPPVSDPQTDDEGCFIKERENNNCYNYGNDIVTNTFAQPGVGSGEKWKKNTCESVGAAAQRDGLVPVGTDLPTKQPETGHFVALFIWPNRNFHWIRMDANATWSHKPGGSPVRNVDDNNKTITDPRKSDFAPWTEFCEFYHTIPSKVSIG